MAFVSISFNEAMNNWKQGADTLNFVYDYGVDGRIAVYQFSKSFGIDFKSHLHIFPKEIYEQCIGKVRRNCKEA